jgi:hypothetical protein
MRTKDAPPAGWYPDPEGGARLRYWEGTDWSDRWRAPPTAGVIKIQAEAAARARTDAHQFGAPSTMGSLSRQDSDEIINQVRLAARAEAERAATMFGAQARSVTSNLTPLISEYTTKITRWFRIASMIAIALLIGWLAFQIFAQVSMFEWIGDRIDNLSNNSGTIVQLQS